MKWTKARQLQICSSCSNEIDPGTVYLASQYSALCKDCGKKHNNGELIYSRKDKSYKDIASDGRTCGFCSGDAIGISFKTGKAYCEMHSGDAHGEVE